MARYIDADREANKFKCSVESMDLNDATKEIVEIIIEFLQNAPTADVEEVVRCGKCFYYNNGECNNPVWSTGEYEIQVFKTDFCSYGERK